MRTALILSSLLTLGACHVSGAQESEEKAGPQARRDFAVGAFDRISLGGGHDVVVTVGGAPSVRAEGDARLIERLEIAVRDGELEIGSKEKWSMGLKGHRRKVTIHVTVPSLRAAQIGGSGEMQIDMVEGASFAGSIGGSGDLHVHSLKVREAVFSIGGSGAIRAAGSAETTQLSIGGSGDLSLENLQARQARISLAGNGDVRARATETANISIAGSGDVTVAGGAKCTISKMGSGEARCVG